MNAGAFQAVYADIADLNSRILNTLTHPKHGAWVRSHWGVQDKAVELMRHAKTAHIECIAGCGVPVFQVRVPADPEMRADAVPQYVGQLHLWALLSAMRAAWADEVAAVALFRASPEALQRLCDWPMKAVRDAAYRHGTVVQIGQNEAASFWRQVLSGARLGGGTGERLVRTLLLMGTETTE